MREVIQNINDITDSREIMESKPNKFGLAFLYAFLSLLIGIIIWAYFSQKEILIKSNAIISSVDGNTIVSSSEQGEVLKVIARDGDLVKKGDTLYLIKNDELLIQKKSYESSLDSNEKELNNWKKLIACINDNKNNFDKNITEEASFYDKYINYKENLKNAYNKNGFKYSTISDINDKISALNEKIEQIKTNLELVTKRIDACTIKSPTDGIVGIINDIPEGSLIQTGEKLASILPVSSSKYKLEIYVNNKDIANLKIGDQVKCSLLSLPKQNLGSIDSKITNISTYAKVNKDDGSNYYIAEALIDKNLVSSKGENIELKQGMLVEARIINGSISYLNYFLQKINLIN